MGCVGVILIGRLYVWSIVFEPLMFFVLFHRNLVGISGNISRILQALVLICLLLKLVIKVTESKSVRLKIVNFTSPLFVNFGIYFFLLVIAGFIGWLSGAYGFSASYQQTETESSFSHILNSAEFRPIFEYVIAAYYIIYFTVLPKCFLKNEKDVMYFFSIFKAFFIISFVIGVIDFGMAAFGHVLVPRHISDGWSMGVGMRFHGLAGEPRHAVPYLFMGLAILHLQAFFQGKKLSKWWGIGIVIAVLLTQSMSGMLGIVAFLGLYSIYSLSSVKGFVVMLSVMTPAILMLTVGVFSSDRIQAYLESISGVWANLEAGEKLPYLMSVQSNDIYPLYDLTIKLRDFDFLPILIGSGLGSASALSQRFLETGAGMYNPNAQFVRILYESGLIGLCFFVLAFTHPVKLITKTLPSNVQRNFIMYMLLLVGCSFGLRTSAPYIYIGIFIAVFFAMREKASRL